MRELFLLHDSKKQDHWGKWNIEGNLNFGQKKYSIQGSVGKFWNFLFRKISWFSSVILKCFENTKWNVWTIKTSTCFTFACLASLPLQKTQTKAKLFWPAYTSLKEQITEVSQICMSYFTLPLFGFYLFLCNSHCGQVFVGRCWSSGREVIVKRICSAKLPVQILDHSQSLLKANFIFLWLTELKLLYVKPTQVMIALKLHQVNFAHLAFHTVVREIMASSGAIAVSKPNQCRNSEGSSRGSFKGQRAPCLTVTGCVLFLVTFF